MNRYLTSRLAAKAGTRQMSLLVHADAAADQIGRAVGMEFERLFAAMHEHPLAYVHNLRIADDMLSRLPLQIWHTLRTAMANLFTWQHDQAADAMLQTLPRPYLRAAMSRRMGLKESAARLMEHGPVAFGFDQGGFTTQAPTLPPADEEEQWRRFLFPAPAADDVRAFLDQILPPPQPIIGTEQNGRSPSSLAGDIAARYGAGQSTAEISRAIRPFFDGSASRAERMARTAGAFIGSNRNLATSQALGDLIIGYQVHSVGGENARHSHALRSGTIYYREPKAGQWGMDVMPTPPQDTQRGPHDDMQAPHGLCYNCRCWLSPVLAPLPAMQSAAFVDNAHQLIPDPAHFSDWFDQAGEPARRKAAGARRLFAVADLLGRPVTWADMVDPATGNLLPIDVLKAESESERAARRAKVQAAISVNRALVRRVAAFGGV